MLGASEEAGIALGQGVNDGIMIAGPIKRGFVLHSKPPERSDPRLQRRHRRHRSLPTWRLLLQTPET